MNYKESVISSQKDLKLIRKNKDYLEVKAKYGPSKETKIPLHLNPELAFLVATIIGDGHLKKRKLQVTIEVQNKDIILKLVKICKSNFGRKFNILSRVKDGKIYSNLLVDSKAIYNLLNLVFEIPIGKKSHLVKVPNCIKSSDLKTKCAFLNGIMITEGGRRKTGYGLSTASFTLWNDLIQLFSDVGVYVKKDKWTHKTYKKEYYGISFKEREYLSLLAGMPERSNGLDLGSSGLVPS